MFRKHAHNQNYYPNRGNELRNRRALSNKLHIVKNIFFKLCVILLFGGIFYVIFFTPILSVKNITIDGNKAINTGDIEGVVAPLINRKILSVLNSNLLLIDTSEIENAVKNRFINIETVRVEKKYPLTIKVTITEKPADIAWCNKIRVEKVSDGKKVSGDEFLASEIPQCYLSDENGIAYEKIGDNVPSNAVKVFQDQSIEIGSKVSDENLKNFIRNIFYNFNNKTGLNLSYLYILPLASRELHLVTDENLKIYFDLNRTADGQISDLTAFIKNEPKTNGNLSKNYDYIDLRIVDRIFVQPKTEVKISN
jgi:hypothetical protein